jgi:ABC-type Fe3+-hydroxamate transport system substrate-binding protein
MSKNRLEIDYVLAPQLKTAPQSPNTEELVALEPDVVIRMSATEADTLTNAGLKSSYVYHGQKLKMLKM